MTETQLTYNLEATLTAPEGVDGYFVSIDVSPSTAGFIVYGYNAKGDMQPIEIHGSHEKLELPYCNPKIYVRYLAGLESLKISTLGWRDKRQTPTRQGH